jgi:hypothetical protein
MKTKKKIISHKDKEILFSDETFVGKFWSYCKLQNKCKKAPYKKLLKIQILKDDYAKYTDNKLKKKMLLRFW